MSKQLETKVQTISKKLETIENMFKDKLTISAAQFLDFLDGNKKIIDKTIESNNDGLKELIETTSNELRTIINVTDGKLDNVTKEITTLREKLDDDFKLIRDYNKAFAFIIWFDFNKLYSNKLRKEAKEKVYLELDTKKSFNTYKQSTVTVGIRNDWACKTSCIDTTLYCVADKSFDTVKVGKNIEIKCSEKEVEPKVKYEDTVAYVLSRPFEFNEGTIIAIANYLKDIMRRDNEYKKYAN